jgi:sugar phosphate isomerase/epimerase
MTIALGCHKWSFSQATTLQAAQIIRALGFERMDIGNAPDIVPAEAGAHVTETVAHLKQIQAQTGVRFVDVFPQLPQPPNHPDAAVRAFSRERLAGWFAIAAEVGLEGVTLTPGRYWPGHEAEEDFQRAAEEMRWAVAEGQRRGVIARIEPHVSSVTWTPFLAVRMVEEAPGLTLTLDHSHFIFHDTPYEHIALMHPYGSHWHARQARPGAICVPTAQGQIDFPRIVRDLIARGYAGTICLEFTPGTWMTPNPVDCVSETLALTAQLREVLGQ